ncbi:FAD dependent oxidoreductase-domain-containing protein [Chytriomyces sp. MP71]|nr:FAD dependent oxidoreductase-domain-containing protein [Chytriomyces sp. MP71]
MADIEDTPRRGCSGSCAKCPSNCADSVCAPFADAEPMSASVFDVVIVGAGAIGCAIARKLSALSLKVAVLEKGSDVASGASKANSGIVHGGYDERNGTLKARVARWGNSLFPRLDEELSFGFRVTGSLVLAFAEDEVFELEQLLENGTKNGIKDLRILGREEILTMEPHINPRVVKALHCPHTGEPMSKTTTFLNLMASGITSPYEYTIALAENAIHNGVQFHLNAEVTDILRLDASAALPQGGFLVRTPLDHLQEYTTKYIINAAGLFSDKIAAMLGAADFSILPRKGEYILLDKSQAAHATRVLFPVPSPVRGKGILVSQTFHGNLLLGPTSRDVNEDPRTNNQILADILGSARTTVPALDATKAITSYSGLRAKCSRKDFIIEESTKCPGLINVAGIDSPGLTSSPAVAELTFDILQGMVIRDTGRSLPANPWFNPTRPPIIYKKGANYKGVIDHPTTPGLNIICRCERVSEAEIVDAIHRPLGAHSTDAVKKRTRAGMGVCQGSFCEPRVAQLIARELNLPVDQVPRRGVGSSLLPHKRVTEEDRRLLETLAKGVDTTSKL